MRSKSIQKSDGSREEAVLESIDKCFQTFVSFTQLKTEESIPGFLIGLLIKLAASLRQQEV